MATGTGNLTSLAKLFNDEDAAIALLESLRWPDGVACPHCGGSDPYRLTVRSVSVPDRDTASEIALCVREDGADLAATATTAGLSVVDARWYLDELDERLRDHVVGAEPGELLGPLPIDDAFILISVVAKDLPTEADPELRARAARALLTRTVDREVDNRVTWHLTP